MIQDRMIDNHQTTEQNYFLQPDHKTLGLIQKLCDELVSGSISYCHWKSNAALDRSASGENDFDLLVRRKDIQRFTEVLIRLGFKRALEQPDRDMPGVLDYYGYDQGSGRLVHVHAHYQLILGHDATKNYHIPIEEPYLSSAIQDGLFKVPSAEFELIILVIRLALKHLTLDTLLLQQGKLSFSERCELDYLAKRASVAEIERILGEFFPCISSKLFNRCFDVLKSGGNTWFRAKLGQRLQKSLCSFARRSQIKDAGLKFWRRFTWPVKSRLFHQRTMKHFASGGLMIAIVGGDGAGKTTILDGLEQWLSNDFALTRIHMGKPKWSTLTIAVRGILKIGRSLGLYPFMRAEINYSPDKSAQRFPGYPYLIRELCTARDRYLTYQSARRQSTNGSIVIIDRFPLKEVKLMDGPQIERMTKNHPANRFINFLDVWEKKYYQEFSAPDLLITLLVDPDVAVRRKTTETEESVRARSYEIWNVDWTKISAHVINAGCSKDEVLKNVKALVWSHL